MERKSVSLSLGEQLVIADALWEYIEACSSLINQGLQQEHWSHQKRQAESAVTSIGFGGSKSGTDNRGVT